MSRSANLDYRIVLRALRRRLPLFLLAACLVPAVALVGSLVQKKQYTGTATLLFRDPQFDQKLFGSSYTQSEPDPTRQAATNVGLVSLPRVAQLAARRLRTMTEAEVQDAVSIGGGGQSDLVTIAAQAPTPELAAQIATTFADTYIDFRRNADRGVITSAEGPLRRQIRSLPPALRNGSLGQSLQARLSQLQVLSQLQTGDAELVQPAEVPLGPSSPQTARNVVLGLLLGLLLGVGLVVLAEALDRRVRDPDEIEELFGVPVLTTVPERSSLAEANAPGVHPAVDTEAFRMLWANLRYFTLSRSIRSVLITSPDRDDGKSTVAWELAAAAASSGSRVLLIEADLRNPTFARRYGLGAASGLTHVLTGELSFAEAVTRRAIRADDESAGTIDVLLAGTRPPNPSDLLQSARMVELMRESRSEYDLVILDTPPAAAISDAIPLITLVEGVLVVVRLGRTLRDHVRRLRRQLEQVEAPVLGLVVNSAEPADPYAYEYGYDQQDPPSTNGHGPAAPARRGGGWPRFVGSAARGNDR